MQQNKNDTTEPEKTEKLCILGEWFVEVDNKGVCIADWAEGALGFILKLKSDAKESYKALKIPRLLSDTLAENAYIVELMDAEVINALKVNSGEKNTEGLLRAEVLHSTPLRGPVLRSNTNGQNEQFLFVNFRKDSAPRFCAVESDNDGKLSLTPHLEDLDLLLQPTNIQEIKNWADNWKKTVVLVNDSNKAYRSQLKSNEETKNYINLIAIDDMLSDKNQPTRWYVCMPAIIYDWASGTLQEAISKGSRGYWPLAMHLKLCEQLLIGLDNLHFRKTLHGDIRPANLMYRGSAEDPAKYSITDYGSFSREKPNLGKDSGHEGHTVVGAALARQRISPFYSPERREGSEREAADVAVIFNISEKDIKNIEWKNGEDKLEEDDYLVILGWRRDLIVNNKVKEEIKQKKNEYLQDFVKTFNSKQNIEDSLQEGDRIRLREYVLDIKAASASVKDNCQLLICGHPHWLVLHDHFVIKANEKEPLPKWLTVSRTVELRQWSAATDLYSVGALCLYSVFRNQEKSDAAESDAIDDQSANPQQKSSSEQNGDNGSKTPLTITELRVFDTSRPKSLEQTTANVQNPDADFNKMIGNMESIPYFQDIWIRLERLRQVIDVVFTKRQTLVPEKIPDLTLEEISLLDAGSFEFEEENKGRALYEYIKEEVSYVTRTAPGMYTILVACDFNFAYFVYFIHFIMCCLHRKTAILDHDRERTIKEPFCDDRCVRPKPDGPAKDALNSLREILQRIETGVFEYLKLNEKNEPGKLNEEDESKKEIFEYSASQSEYKVRLENIVNKNKIKELESENIKFKNLVDSINLLDNEKQEIDNWNWFLNFSKGPFYKYKTYKKLMRKFSRLAEDVSEIGQKDKKHP